MIKGGFCHIYASYFERFFYCLNRGTSKLALFISDHVHLPNYKFNFNATFVYYF